MILCETDNSYLNAPCKKIWFKAVAECGEYHGKVMILVRALYGINMLGASWRSMFKEFSEKNLHFKSSQINPNVYNKRNRKY